MQLPLVLFYQPIGQRNYFDCYESALGGLLATAVNNYEFVLNLYSLIDCLALKNDGKEKVYLLPKADDINAFIINMFGLGLTSSL